MHFYSSLHIKLRQFRSSLGAGLRVFGPSCRRRGSLRSERVPHYAVVRTPRKSGERPTTFPTRFVQES
eukprot:3293730-Alexandrium_andersonii.AAC.1